MMRRYQTTPYEVLILEGDELRVENLRDHEHSVIRLEDVRSVRLTLEDGCGTCVVRLASGAKREIRSFQRDAFDVWHHDASDYRRFIVELHRGLAQHAPSVELIAGRRRSWWLGRVLIGLSAMVALASLASALVLGSAQIVVALGLAAGAAIMGIHGFTLIQQRESTYSALAVPPSHLPRDRD